MIPFHNDGHWVRLVAGRFALLWIDDTKNRRRLFGSKGHWPNLRRSACIPLCTMLFQYEAKAALFARSAHGHAARRTQTGYGWTSAGTYLLGAGLLNMTRIGVWPSPARCFGRAAGQWEKRGSRYGMVLAQEHQTYASVKVPLPHCSYDRHGGSCVWIRWRFKLST